MSKYPEAPDPEKTAQAQASMNRDAAVTQQNLNMVDQITPWASLKYTQTGQTFSPSETGQTMWFNPTTGKYRTDGPAITGYNETSTPQTTTGQLYNRNGEYNGGKTTGGTTRTPIYEDGWQEVKGSLVPKYTATTELSPEQQAIFNSTQTAQGNLASLAADRSAWLKGYLGKEMDFSGAPALRTAIGNGYSGDIGGSYKTAYGDGYTTDLGPDWKTSYEGAENFSANRQQVVDAIKARAAPGQAADDRALETQLIGRGLRPGTAAWNSEMARNSAARNDFNLAADLAGGQEQSRLVGMARDAAGFSNDANLQRAAFSNDAIASRFAAENAASLGAADFRNNAALTDANFGNAARSQWMQEAYAQRNQPLQELSALMSGSQVQAPQFQSTPTTGVAGVDYAGMVQNKYQADSQAAAAKMGGLFGLLAAPFSMFSLKSDRRLKTDIRRVGMLDNGLPVYSYRYRGETATQIGLMADEVEKIHPEAVAIGDDGFKRVRYDLAVEAA